MLIKFIKDGQIIKDKRLRAELGKHAFNALNQDWMRWEKTSFLRQGKDGKFYFAFVGLFLFDQTIYLSLPKSISIQKNFSDDFKLNICKKYMQFALSYFQDIKNLNVSGKDQYPFCNFCDFKSFDLLLEDAHEKSVKFQLLFAMKFDFVFEWLLSKFFDNQIHMGRNREVLLKSKWILKPEMFIDMNTLNLNVYRWNAKGTNKKDKNTGKQTKVNLDTYFNRQNIISRNIPDLLSEVNYNEQKRVCVMDAKYISFNEEDSYLIPGKMDIYKQFFYQELVKELYKQNGMDIPVYNYFFVPDYKGDAKRMANSLFRFAGDIVFPYHEEHMIGVIQVNIDDLINYCLNPKDVFYKEILQNRKKSYSSMKELVYDTVLFQKGMKCL